jgi:16S rRNA U1498 N3-methylase RsmE
VHLIMRRLNQATHHMRNILRLREDKALCAPNSDP